jgi:cytochrome P450
MRLQTIGGDMLERVVGSSGAEIAESWVPGGTMVAVSSHVVNRDESIWGSRPNMYNPDHWIEADEAQRRRMERSLIAFGAGKRMCLGQHIAWLEMKKLIPRLLTAYKVRTAIALAKDKIREVNISSLLTYVHLSQISLTSPETQT